MAQLRDVINTPSHENTVNLETYQILIFWLKSDIKNLASKKCSCLKKEKKIKDLTMAYIFIYSQLTRRVIYIPGVNIFVQNVSYVSVSLFLVIHYLLIKCIARL